MLEQGLINATAGAVYPVAFAAIVVILGRPDPIRRSLAFLAGALIVSLIGFAVVIGLIRSLNFTPRGHPTVNGIIKVVLGALLLALAARTLYRHRHRPPEASTTPVPEQPQPSAVSLRRMFISGVLVYIPGLFLIASARAIAASNAGVALTTVTAVAATILLLLIVEVPIIAVAVSPDRVRPALVRINTWARTHSGPIVLLIELAGGAYLLVSGIRTLTAG